MKFGYLFSTLASCAMLMTLQAYGQNSIKQPGYYVLYAGGHRITALSDGIFPAPAHALLQEADSLTVAQSLRHAYLPDTVETSINSYLIATENKLILVDAGGGTQLGPNAGHLIDNLRAAGYSPEQITDILITHIHIDHASGLSRAGKILFPNATVHVNKKDLDFWAAHAQAATNEHWGITLNRPAYLMLKLYLDKGKVRPFDSNQEILPGISAIAYAGHTDGHTMYLFQRGKDKIAFWGDLIHIAAVQLEHPDMTVSFDYDKSRAISQRHKAYNEAATQGYLVAAAHISFPGIGHVAADGKGFRWYPLNYSISAVSK
jgi:glyoxylase-like metal-dependent hydrolase (beta-lactamase superfamily II)